MLIPVEILQKAADHRKSCQECTKDALCDKMVEINTELLEASFK